MYEKESDHYIRCSSYYCGEHGYECKTCEYWTGITDVLAQYGDVFGLTKNGTLRFMSDKQWHDPMRAWEKIRIPEFHAFYGLDDQITMDALEEASVSVDVPFTNKYGTPTTVCAHGNCSAFIAPSGDTNCCKSHSNRCLECYCYIDGDAMYCMACIERALK